MPLNGINVFCFRSHFFYGFVLFKFFKIKAKFNNFNIIFNFYICILIIKGTLTPNFTTSIFNTGYLKGRTLACWLLKHVCEYVKNLLQNNRQLQ